MNKIMPFLLFSGLLCGCGVASRDCGVIPKSDSTGSLSAVSGIEDILLARGDTKALMSSINFYCDDLYKFNFNVGQANFIVLRRGQNVVIVDAGSQDINYLKRFEGIMNYVFDQAKVDAVFVTHPDQDHYNLLTDFTSKRYPGAFQDTAFFLGGTEVVGIPTDFNSKVTCLSNEQHEVFFLDGVRFRVFGTLPLVGHAKKSKNKLSLLIQASYYDNNILFLGDAEGDNFSRLWGISHDLRSLFLGHSPIIPPTSEQIFLFNEMQELIDNYIQHGSQVFNDERFCSFASRYWSLYLDVCSTKKSLLPDLVSVLGEFMGQNFTFAQDWADLFSLSLYDYVKNWISEENLGSVATFYDEAIQYFEEFRGKSDFDELFIHQISVVLAKLSSGGYFLTESGPNEYCLSKSESDQGSELESDQGSESESESDQGLDICLSWVFGYMNLFGEVLNPLSSFPKTMSLLFSDLLRANPTSSPSFVNVMGAQIEMLAKRKMFLEATTVDLPHHGTQTENSQVFEAVLSSNINSNVLYIINSSPFGDSSIPKASSFYMAPSFPKYPLHYVLYSHDNIGQTRGNKSVQVSLIEKPIYMTGAAEQGVIVTKFNQTGSYLLAWDESSGVWCCDWINTRVGDQKNITKITSYIQDRIAALRSMVSQDDFNNVKSELHQFLGAL